MSLGYGWMEGGCVCWVVDVLGGVDEDEGKGVL